MEIYSTEVYKKIDEFIRRHIKDIENLASRATERLQGRNIEQFVLLGQTIYYHLLIEDDLNIYLRYAFPQLEDAAKIHWEFKKRVTLASKIKGTLIESKWQSALLEAADVRNRLSHNLNENAIKEGQVTEIRKLLGEVGTSRSPFEAYRLFAIHFHFRIHLGMFGEKMVREKEKLESSLQGIWRDEFKEQMDERFRELLKSLQKNI